MSSSSQTGVLARDTTRGVEALQVRIWRSLPPAGLARLIAGTSRSIRELALAGLRTRHPGVADNELAGRLAAILLGATLARATYADPGPTFRSDAA